MSESSNPQDLLSQLAAIVESAHEAVFAEDVNGAITSWNRGAEELFGYSAAEIIGQPAAVLFPEAHQGKRTSDTQQVLRGIHVAAFDTVGRQKNGQEIDISLAISPIHASDGAIVGASMIAHDITQRKDVERKLAHLAAIVSSSDDAIVSMNLNGVLDSWNAGAFRLFGYTADEAIGQPAAVLVPPDEVNEERPLLKMIRTGERVEHFETRRRCKDGSVVDVSLTLSPIHDSQGVIIGASGIARDISDQIWAKEAAKRRDAAQAKLAQLTERESEVLSLVVAGNANKVIASKLDLSEKTIEKYRARITKKLGVRSVAELVRIALVAEL